MLVTRLWVGSFLALLALGVLLGAWAARRAVRPLADAAQAAQAIAVLWNASLH